MRSINAFHAEKHECTSRFLTYVVLYRVRISCARIFIYLRLSDQATLDVAIWRNDFRHERRTNKYVHVCFHIVSYESPECLMNQSLYFLFSYWNLYIYIAYQILVFTYLREE